MNILPFLIGYHKTLSSLLFPLFVDLFGVTFVYVDQSNPVPLSSDAFSALGRDDALVHNQEVREATERLIKQVRELSGLFSIMYLFPLIVTHALCTGDPCICQLARRPTRSQLC
jgi:hypothetical protein